MQLPLDAIDSPDLILRDQIDQAALQDLAHSMATLGLQNPITVRPAGDRWQIEAGHRRYLAAQMLAWKTIPAIATDHDDAAALAASVHENIFRENLTPLEEAAVVDHLLHTEGRTLDDAARLLRHTRAWVEARAAILHYPPELQRAVHQGTVSRAVARHLARITDPGQLALAIDAAHSDGMTERSALLWLKQWEIAEATRGTTHPAPMPTLESIEAEAQRTICDFCDQSVYRNTTKLLVMCFDCIRTLQAARKGPPQAV